MKKYWVIIFIVCMLYSCTTEIKRAKKPGDLIPADTMVALLTDLTIIESHISNKYPPAIIKNELMINSGDTVLASYGVDYKRWERSMKYYAANQQLMMGINDSVIAKLSAIEQKLP